MAMTSRYEARYDTPIVRDYGNLLLDVVAFVSDGVVCFFLSYRHFESVDVVSWCDQGILGQLQRNIIVFIETRDAAKTSLALSNYLNVLYKECFKK